MNKSVCFILASVFFGAAIVSAHAATGSTTGTQESYQKKALEDFQLKKKRLANDYDVALKNCAKVTNSLWAIVFAAAYSRTPCRNFTSILAIPF